MTDNQTVAYRGFPIAIQYDDAPASPREWDNLGTMVCSHRRYALGDVQVASGDIGFMEHLDQEHAIIANRAYSYLTESDETFIRNWIQKQVILLPLYLYDHSGITMNTSGFSCPWDSGQVGWIYVTRERVRNEYGVARISMQLERVVQDRLRAEVAVYNDYLTGNVYGFNIHGIDAPDNSCWGFYGDDHETSGLLDMARQLIDGHIEAVTRSHVGKWKVQIQKRAPLERRDSLADRLSAHVI
jgi:hypothetical protein